MNPYDEGFDAGFHDRAVDCPYEEGSFDCNAWMAGYDAGVEEAWVDENWEGEDDGQDN